VTGYHSFFDSGSATTQIVASGSPRCARTLCLAAPVAAGPFEDGVAAAERGDYATALRLWHLLADQGAAEAQTNLGKMYNLGKGVPQDFTLALTRDLD